MQWWNIHYDDKDQLTHADVTAGWPLAFAYVNGNRATMTAGGQGVTAILSAP